MTDTHQFNQRTKRGLDLATAAELGDLLHELTHNKATRKIIAKAIKDAKPDSPHAQAFSDVDVEDKFESFKADQEARDLKRQNDEILARMNQKRSALLSGGPDGEGRKYAEDDVKKIEDLMQRKGITDYEDGATLYAATLPPLDPQPGIDLPVSHGTTWDFPEWSKFGIDPVKASRDTAHTVITEFMRKR
jgi:hypothetical protein